MTDMVFTKSSHELGRVTTAQPGFWSVHGLFGRLRRMLAVWHDRDVGRRQLQRLNERGLRDIGITAAEAESEAARPFWQG